MIRPVNILVAEDDLDDQEIFLTFLGKNSNLNFMPFANDGIELISALEESAEKNELPHIIILAQNMPKQNGLQTLIRLKADPKYQHIPVIVYSTYINDWLSEQCIMEGAAMVVSKPSDRAGYNNFASGLLNLSGNPQSKLF